ncbi:MAG: hypothetical protein HQK83_13965, partial [Fibrobacteria bacterium]|nr:hypothetical protein [Fibrobacteria bacterium]
MLPEMENMYLGIRLYRSENPQGCNAVVRVLNQINGVKELFGVLYVSFEKEMPDFVWMNNGLTSSQREYLELKAQ